jgi:hypothetical protein
MNQNRLNPKNCNKAMCKSCIFGSNPIPLDKERILEIHTYLSNFSKSHICHITNKTCYGALQFQSTLLHKLGLLLKPTVESLLETAKQFLKLS